MASGLTASVQAFYDTPDGVAGAPVGIIGAARPGNGTLLFVRGGGLTLVDPRELIDDGPSTPPPLPIEAVVANERRFNPAAVRLYRLGRGDCRSTTRR